MKGRRKIAVPNNVTARAAAAVGLLFGALSAVAGTRVLAGNDPGYVVLTWLVEYNVAAGIVGVVAGAGLWRIRGWAVRLAGTLAVFHGLVLVILLTLLGGGRPVAVDSVVAMLLRTAVWSAIAAVTRRARG